MSRLLSGLRVRAGEADLAIASGAHAARADRRHGQAGAHRRQPVPGAARVCPLRAARVAATAGAAPVGHPAGAGARGHGGQGERGCARRRIGSDRPDDPAFHTPSRRPVVERVLRVRHLEWLIACPVSAYRGRDRPAAARPAPVRSVAGGASVTGGAAIVYGVKALVGRTRPALWNTETYWGSSFPSGHTLAVAAFATATVLCVARIWPRAHTSVLAAALLWILLVAFSRLVLGVHWPTDVLVAACIGVFLPLAISVAHDLRR
ncbi:MAG: phosphatase PAP2 family protein [Betaproteobacteria bacterium]|nr:phosphatase PAP2 family protein [Betaproteobacteria bacterium]